MNMKLKAALMGAAFVTAGLSGAEAATSFTLYSGDGTGTCNGGSCVSITPHSAWGDVSDNAGLAADTADWVSYTDSGIGGSVLPSYDGPRTAENATMHFSNTFSLEGTGSIDLWVLADDTAIVRITGPNDFSVLDFGAFGGQINPCAGGGQINPVGCVEADMGAWSFAGLAGGDYTLDIYSFQTGGDVFGMQYAMNVSAIPEPATWLMMIMGFGLVGLASRRRSAIVAA